MSTATSAPSGPTSGRAIAKTTAKRRHHRDLRQQVIGEVVADQPVGDLDQPPGQRRQLVVAELPFAAVDQRLDQVERQIGVEQRRQHGPDRGMQAPGWRRRPAPARRRSGSSKARLRAAGIRVPMRLKFLRITGDFVVTIAGLRGCADPWRHEHWGQAARITCRRGTRRGRPGLTPMRRISAIFIAVCMVLIAGSIGAVLFLAFKLDARTLGDRGAGRAHRHGALQHRQQPAARPRRPRRPDRRSVARHRRPRPPGGGDRRAGSTPWKPASNAT